MNNESQIVLYQPDDSIRLEVKIDAGNETVWLNRNQIAELFGRDVKTIGKHINNALREELATETETNVSVVNNQKNPTVAKFATVQIEAEFNFAGGVTPSSNSTYFKAIASTAIL